MKNEYKKIKVGFSKDKGVIVAFDGKNFIAFFRKRKNGKRR